MHLLLVAGFLGSGKTTFAINLARAAVGRGRRVAILVNEIGEIGIDNQLMRQLDLNVWELLSGCICCTLSADLVSSLEKLEADYHPDLVILEPSGAAELSNILKALPYYRGAPLQSVRSVSILDPLRLFELYQVLTPLITNQILGADWLVVNKADVASQEQLEQARRIAAEVSPAARLLTLSARRELPPWLVAELVP